MTRWDRDALESAHTVRELQMDDWQADRVICEQNKRIEQLERELADMTQLKDAHAEMRAMYLAELAAEKALADRLYYSASVDDDYSWSDAVAAYRKARGL